ncbi:MAG: choice-of-anchor D domain-containing protein [Vicinamibacterales bacterium]
MRSPVRLLCLALLPLTLACGGGGSSSPTGPSTTAPANTRVISVSGNLTFGDVAVGSRRELGFTIANTGTTTLTVSGMSVSGGLASQLAASWTSGQIPPGGTQPVTVTFQPTSAGSFTGVLTVNADHTGGTNTIAVSAHATGVSVQGSWSGRYEVQRCDGTGSNQDYFCSTNRGAFPPGASLPIAMNLTQSGSSVTGSITFGQVTGSVNGTINGAGTLVLQGTAVGGPITVTLSSFTVSVNGTSMTGNFTYNAGLAGVPGVAVVTSRLSGMSRR